MTTDENNDGSGVTRHEQAVPAHCPADRDRAYWLAENLPDIVARFDSGFRHLYVNPAAEAVAGRSRSEFLGRTSADLGMPTEQVEFWQRSLAAVFATGTPQTLEFPFVAEATAEGRLYEWRLVPECGNSGAVESVLTIGRDITERMAYEVELRRRGSELQKRVKELNCLYGVAELTRRADLPLPELFAAVLEQVTAAYRFPAIACARIRLDGEYRSRSFVETPWQQAATIPAGEPTGTIEVFYREQPNDGAPFLDQEQVLLDAVAQQLGRAIRERSLRAARDVGERRFRSLFQNLPDAYALHEILLDGQGNPADYRFVEVNPAFEQMLGLRHDEVVGRRILELLPGTERYWIEVYGRVALTGEPLHLTRYSAVFGRYFEVSAFSPERGFFATVFADVTEAHRLRESLERGNALLQRVFESVHVLLAYMDCDFNFLLVNRAYAAADGREPEEFRGRNHFELYPNPENEAIFRRVIATGEPFVVYGRPFAYPDHPGRPVTFWDWRLEPVRGKNGTTEGIVLSLLNVTDRIRAERETARIHRLNQLLLDSVGEGIYGLDLNGNCTFVNPAAARMLGYRQEEIIGRSAHRLFHGVHADGTPYPEEGCPVHAAFRSGASTAGTDEVYWRRDGTAFPIEYISTPLLDEGKAVGAVTSFLDITERQRAEAALLRSELRLAQAQRIARIGSWELDLTADVLVGSNEFYSIIETDPEHFEASYRAMLSAIHPEDREVVDVTYRRSLEERTPFSIDHRLLVPGGRIKHVHQQCETSYEDGRPVRSLGTLQDITERKQAEEALKAAYAKLRAALEELRVTQQQVIQAEKLSALGTLAAGVAHELNNPLMGVMGYVAQARFSTTDGSVEQVLKRAEHELERMRALLKNMLGFARPIEEKMSSVDVAEVIERSLALMTPELKARRITVTTAIPDDLPPVLAKEGHLQQVFVNLLMNARDALEARPKRTIHIAAERQERSVAVSFSDSGPGVPEEVRGRIFDPFFTTKPPGQGTGLGLSISRNIMTDLGGSIAYEPREGEGAAFTVTLPLDRPAGGESA